ncbi:MULTISPECIES: NucA/NucB deoxyribonuclease domain-containing protein [unclassified Moorena]|uniref:NucA/NucB deoxyribonuclease domain-containing protein n=1 Tax=unclassified Moorena TaxID=2683338 RepID=UPI001400E6E3|nr:MULTISPECIES: NucA/NucB deoxyribonuclease domain-containing protein [unclassified Moorena]NEO15350.1 hypothetical protein [Moorena sp. SIO3E8]NEQ03332.1 hypothetical protein [Moorena sp. SIO3F7]
MFHAKKILLSLSKIIILTSTTFTFASEALAIPTIFFQRSKCPSIYANMSAAFRRRNNPIILQRTTVKSRIRKNRRLSCGKFKKIWGPPPKGFNCDEYPFASTVQGGAGAHAGYVWANQNSKQGASLVKFYRQEGIGHGSSFQVRIIGRDSTYIFPYNRTPTSCGFFVNDFPIGRNLKRRRE